MTHRFRTAFMGPSGFVTSAPGAGRRQEEIPDATTKAVAAKPLKLPRVAAFRMPRDVKKTAAA